MQAAPPPLPRGAVVLRSRLLGVVWSCDVACCVLLPVLSADPDEAAIAGDVRVERMDDLATMALGRVDLVVRTSRPIRISRAGQKLLGTVSGVLACLISQALVRSYASAVVEAKWSGSAASLHSRAANARRL